VATTTSNKDLPLVEFLQNAQIPFFRGSEQDLLDRYYRCAGIYAADPVVRITSDCPLIDPEIVDQIVANHQSGQYDVYGLDGEFPDGLDCTAYSFRALELAWKQAQLPSDREHVGPYMSRHPELFKTGSYRPFSGLRHHRWTLDEDSDYRFLLEVFDRLYRPERLFLTADVLALLEKEPELMKINQGIVRNEGYLRSLEKDKT
jgi:spore coat polysaccharide biosynthesis protein SpsF